MLRIVITGGIACGKSTFSKVLKNHGVAVCEADDLAHAVIEPIGLAYKEVLKEFGRGILYKDGRINRKKLGKEVFSDRLKLARLNDIIHPYVVEEWNKWVDDCGRSKHKICMVTIPLLYETNQQKGWDAVICVASSSENVLKRLMKRGLTESEAKQRISAQLPLKLKILKADYVVLNNGNRCVLEEQAEKILNQIAGE